MKQLLLLLIAFSLFSCGTDGDTLQSTHPTAQILSGKTYQVKKLTGFNLSTPGYFLMGDKLVFFNTTEFTWTSKTDSTYCTNNRGKYTFPTETGIQFRECASTQMRYYFSGDTLVLDATSDDYYFVPI